jgi:LysM repeat protein
MSYSIYLNNILLPVTPGSVSIEADGKNETIELIDGSEINILIKPGLKVINFEARLPQQVYPYAVYEGGEFKPAQYYIEAFEKLRADKTPFQFILTRFVQSGYFSETAITTMDLNSSFDTNLKVAIESMAQKEDADNGTDIILDITLKEYIDYSTKTFIIETPTYPETEVLPDRPVDPQPQNVSRTYTVVSGDTLWKIAARELGNGARYGEIAAKNNISDPNRISVGQVLDLTGL